MGRKLVPTKEIEFVTKAETFARTILPEPERFGLTPADAQAMADVARRFRETYQAARGGAQSRAATRAKNEAKAQTKHLYTRCMNLIRINESIDAQARFLAGIVDRTTKLKSRACPQEPPRLKFAQAHHVSGATPVHELQFRSLGDWNQSKPEGAVRLELFVDLIPPEEPIPKHPGANHGARPWYLRSYTRSPIKLVPPMANVPMRVVYWGRWAGAGGDVGPYSATTVAWMEGGSHLPQLNPSKTPLKLMEDATTRGPAEREMRYQVAVIQAQMATFMGMKVETNPALEAPHQEEQKQLEAPNDGEAA